MNEYDEIKSLLKKSRLLKEDVGPGPINLAKDIESNITQSLEKDVISNKEKNKKYRISGGILSIYGDNTTEVTLTTDDKIAFQETMDEFVNEVSDLVDFGPLNLYRNSAEWSGKIVDFDVDFFMTIGEQNGVYINGNQLKLDEKFMDVMSKLTAYYEKFKSKWARIIASKKKTKVQGG